MRCYDHVLSKEDENMSAKGLKLEVRGSRGRGRPKKMWKKQVENDMKKNGQVKEDACDRAKWPYEIRPTLSREQYRIQNKMMLLIRYPDANIVSDVVTCLFTKMAWPRDSKVTFRSSSQAAICPLVYHTRWTLHCWRLHCLSLLNIYCSRAENLRTSVF